MDMGMLQAAGINCHLKDEYTITIDPLLSPALGGMKLMVEEADLQQARALLQERDETSALPNDWFTGPYLGLQQLSYRLNSFQQKSIKQKIVTHFQQI